MQIRVQHVGQAIIVDFVYCQHRYGTI